MIGLGKTNTKLEVIIYYLEYINKLSSFNITYEVCSEY